jgi:hypothetical protein
MRARANLAADACTMPQLPINTGSTTDEGARHISISKQARAQALGSAQVWELLYCRQLRELTIAPLKGRGVARRYKRMPWHAQLFC